MNSQDNNFFESYKRLDRLCGDILNCKNGISEYIQQMEQTGQSGFKVANWTEDYKMLTHVRLVRNQIAHDTSNASFSTETDLEFVNSFYNRILKQDDPFAHLRKMNSTEFIPNNNLSSSPSKEHFQYQPLNNSNNNFVDRFLIGIGIIAAIIVILILFCLFGIL